MLPLSRTFAFRATLCLIWALALWHSWICRGLFVDGSAFLVQIVRREWFFEFYPPRIYAMVAAQLPVMTAVILGVTDLHLLARLLSFGLFGLPTLFYTLALARARHDTVLLAAVIAVIGIVFMPTSFFIVGEYNTVYALVIFIAMRLATAVAGGQRLSAGEGIVHLALAAFSIRVYEAMLYLGPLLAAMTLWRLARAEERRVLPTVLFLLAAIFFLCGFMVAFESLRHPWSEGHLQETLTQAKDFWQNMQFLLVFAGMLLVIAWAVVRPGDLMKRSPYLWAGAFLLVLALSPLLAFSDTLVRPLAKSQYVARSMAGLVVAGVVIFAWLYVADAHWRLKALVVLRRPEPARHLLLFAVLIPLAMVPSDLFLSATWIKYLDSIQKSVREHGGVIAFEDTSLARWPDILLVENWVLPSQSLALREDPGDGVVVPPRDFKDWVPFPPLEPPNLGRFYWHD
jgi:hypothetical protein